MVINISHCKANKHTYIKEIFFKSEKAHVV